MLGDMHKRRYPEFERRVNFIALMFVLACGVLVMRLWELQVVRWSEFGSKSESNRLRIQRIESPRGMIYGRLGDDESVVLVDNRASRDLMFVLAECDIDPMVVFDRLGALVGLGDEALREDILRVAEKNQPHLHVTIKRDVPQGILARVEEYRYALPGVITVVRPQRRYLYGKVGGQVLGYVGEVNPRELEALRPRYRMGDLIGKAGLERAYESVLHGTAGQMLVTQFAAGEPQLRTDAYGNPYVEHDSFGHQLKVEEKVQEPIPGRPLHVTLDIGMQGLAEDLLKDHIGAIVVLNAETGAVLALASAPGYNPSVFVTRGMNRYRKDILEDEPSRLLNRAFQEVYAPGSTFKVLLASAALEEGIIDSTTTFYCPGKFRLNPGGRPWHCWRRSGHGSMAVVDALAYSCDVFFYNVGLRLGVDKIHQWALRLGFGKTTGLDLPLEAPGLIPSRQWKEARLKPEHPNEPWEYRWYPGDTVNLSIGQGAAIATPLQTAVLMAAIVNGGRVVHPFLNAELARQPGEIQLSEDTLRTIWRGLRKCVEKGPPAPTGTGREAAVEGLVILGKTGTSQMVNLAFQETFEHEEDIPFKFRDHAWFIAAAPELRPPLALSILVEHGRHGSTVAAPLAKQIFEYAVENFSQERLQLTQNTTDILAAAEDLP